MIANLNSHSTALYSLAILAIAVAISSILIRAGMRSWKVWRVSFLWSISQIGVIAYTNTQSKQAKLSDEQLYVIGAIAIIGILSYIQGFVRRRCPKCGTTNVDCTNAKELDRWIGSKRVQERIISGSGKNRKEKTIHKTIAVTYVAMEYKYLCSKCHYGWLEEAKEER